MHSDSCVNTLNTLQLILAILAWEWELKRFHAAEVAFMVTQCHWHWCHLIGCMCFPISLHCKYVFILYRF